ncbi:conserved hypothetical protein [Perkinsus marinus ATCC 50983]|uniref:Uncharacterized protein n=1 Tax=Perkinsus marinus (strain ATCC 50983 / TXsc) TaxID=423536 RepID=C5K522_PERM5|nr:conserved hypothetical protein [Perkinsus marinus ATCC 50983]EER20444.1 conserved hypothetical protein [Perkinsus marinus ATCC 50983]|eukprot:XP_002788648.1 conserved hypothetical protein [Perkinsus marinus ATCC 50983]
MHLIESGLLVANAGAILNERRVLRKYNLDKPGFDNGVKGQLSTLLYSVRTFGRCNDAAISHYADPIVIMNLLVILYELIFG